MVEEQPQNAAHSSGLIRFKHICVCSHWLSLPTATAHSHAQMEAYTYAYTCKCTHAHFCPTHSLHSIPPSFHPSLYLSLSLSSVLHANELRVLMPEHYRCVCLISLLPFLFPGDYPVFKRNRPSSLHSAPLPASQSVSQPASQRSNLSSQHHYHLNVLNDMTAEHGLRAALCVYVCAQVYVCNLCEYVCLIEGLADKLKSLLQMLSIPSVCDSVSFHPGQEGKKS